MAIKISAPGKLFIAGEWAILEPKNFGIVAAINKRVFAEIKKSPDGNIYLTLRDFGLNNLKADFSYGKLKFLKKLTQKERKILNFSKKAIETTLQHLSSWKPFQLKIWGESSGKIGFGFSAASAVAIVSAILAFHKRKLEKEKVFKISALSHFLAQGETGSGADIAASVYGGCLIYKRFNPDWLKKEIKKGENIRKIIEKPWPNFYPVPFAGIRQRNNNQNFNLPSKITKRCGVYIEKLNWPKGLKLLVGWTGEPASTRKLIRKIKEWQKKKPKDYNKIISEIGKTTKKMILSFKKKDKKEILKLIKENEKYLKELGEKAKVKIETKKLRELSEIAEKFGGAGKPSGAGGGDCGICLCLSQKNAEKIKKEWQKKGILPIETKIDFSGVTCSS